MDATKGTRCFISNRPRALKVEIVITEKLSETKQNKKV